MTTTVSAPLTQMEPREFEWTREDYYGAAEAGFFRGRRVELIGGRILEMAPQRNLHVYCTTRAAKAMEAAFGANVWVRVQAPLSLGAASDPEPDVAVTPGPATPAVSNPSDALIVIEISDTTLRFDQTEKAGLYASCAIADYWIVNLVDKRLEVYRRPIADPAGHFGHRYADVTLHDATQSIAPLAAPSAAIAVKELLP